MSSVMSDAGHKWVRIRIGHVGAIYWMEIWNPGRGINAFTRASLLVVFWWPVAGFLKHIFQIILRFRILMPGAKVVHTWFKKNLVWPSFPPFNSSFSLLSAFADADSNSRSLRHKIVYYLSSWGLLCRLKMLALGIPSRMARRQEFSFFPISSSD